MDKFLTNNVIISSTLTKRCPSCKLERDIIDFHGVIKLNTSKCYNCNLRALKYVKKKYVPKNLKSS